MTKLVEIREEIGGELESVEAEDEVERVISINGITFFFISRASPLIQAGAQP